MNCVLGNSRADDALTFTFGLILNLMIPFSCTMGPQSRAACPLTFLRSLLLYLHSAHAQVIRNLSADKPSQLCFLRRKELLI
jgi:hypothetical protein